MRELVAASCTIGPLYLVQSFGEWCYAASSLGSHLASYSSVGDLRLAIERIDL